MKASELLTGKAKEEFLKFAEKKHWISSPFIERDILLQALILDWLDSVCIYVCSTAVFPIDQYGFSYSIDLKSCYKIYKTRQEAITEAIKKANEIYNEKKE